GSVLTCLFLVNAVVCGAGLSAVHVGFPTSPKAEFNQMRRLETVSIRNIPMHNYPCLPSIESNFIAFGKRNSFTFSTITNLKAHSGGGNLLWRIGKPDTCKHSRVSNLLLKVWIFSFRDNLDIEVTGNRAG